MSIDLTKHPLELQAAAIIAAATLTAANRFGGAAQSAEKDPNAISVEQEVAERAGAILTHLQEMPWELR